MWPRPREIRSYSKLTGALREHGASKKERYLMRNESGQDLLEYALLVALIALVCVLAITSTGSGVRTVFNNISEKLTATANAGATR